MVLVLAIIAYNSLFFTYAQPIYDKSQSAFFENMFYILISLLFWGFILLLLYNSLMGYRSSLNYPCLASLTFYILWFVTLNIRLLVPHLLASHSDVLFGLVSLLLLSLGEFLGIMALVVAVLKRQVTLNYWGILLNTPPLAILLLIFFNII